MDIVRHKIKITAYQSPMLTLPHCLILVMKKVRIIVIIMN